MRKHPSYNKQHVHISWNSSCCLTKTKIFFWSCINTLLQWNLYFVLATISYFPMLIKSLQPIPKQPVFLWVYPLCLKHINYTKRHCLSWQRGWRPIGNTGRMCGSDRRHGKQKWDSEGALLLNCWGTELTKKSHSTSVLEKWFGFCSLHNCHMQLGSFPPKNLVLWLFFPSIDLLPSSKFNTFRIIFMIL